MVVAASPAASGETEEAGEWQSLRLSKQKLVESLGGATMRNVDGRRITIKVEGDGSLLCTDSEVGLAVFFFCVSVGGLKQWRAGEQGNRLTTRIDPKTKLILADLSSAVIASKPPAWERCLDSTGFAGLAPETVNGRVAMVAILLVMATEVVTQKSLFAQVGGALGERGGVKGERFGGTLLRCCAGGSGGRGSGWAAHALDYRSVLCADFQWRGA